MRHITYLSLGAGVQSTALYVLSTLGKTPGVPRFDYAIFADTQDEPAYVYDYLASLRAWAWQHNGPEILTTTYGCLSRDTLDRHKGQRTRFAAIPAFTMGTDGRVTPLRRQCTREYKVSPIEHKVRELAGVAPRKHAKYHVRADAYIGISLDEATRMKPSRTPWITNHYPLVDLRLKRAHCAEIVVAAGLPRPEKSACRFCPYHDDAYWLWLKTNHPEEFLKACAFDEGIRDMSKSGVKGKVYIHRAMEPLRQIDFEERRRLPLFETDQFQNECEGMCGV